MRTTSFVSPASGQLRLEDEGEENALNTKTVRDQVKQVGEGLFLVLLSWPEAALYSWREVDISRRRKQEFMQDYLLSMDVNVHGLPHI